MFSIFFWSSLHQLQNFLCTLKLALKLIAQLTRFPGAAGEARCTAERKVVQQVVWRPHPSRALPLLSQGSLCPLRSIPSLPGPGPLQAWPPLSPEQTLLFLGLGIQASRGRRLQLPLPGWAGSTTKTNMTAGSQTNI